MSKGKGQQVMEPNLFPLEFQLPDGNNSLQTAQNVINQGCSSPCSNHVNQAGDSRRPF